ncbi:hypothetical protein L2E82_38468 [Cichorium intybus]|uniref:Uncharacterized protein n=1 Tax=Cichorium intybus TaxID=13427 RepID=A0ACB9AGS8_CICIN|nr:hypothetical protein L2E82_38468 [Cichorium intybus]
MGCVFGKDISSPRPRSSEIVVEKRHGRDREMNGHSGRKERASATNPDNTNNDRGGGDSQNRVSQKGEKDRNVQPKGEIRRSKPNPRLSNPPKNIDREQNGESADDIPIESYVLNKTISLDIHEPEPFGMESLPTANMAELMVGNMHLAMKSNSNCELLHRSVLRQELDIPTYDVAAIVEFVIDFVGRVD